MLTIVRRMSGRIPQGFALTVAAVLAAHTSAVQADVLPTMGSFATYVAGSTTWNGSGQYTTSYHYNSDSGTDTVPLGLAYYDKGNPEYQYPVIAFSLPTLSADQIFTRAQITVHLASSGGITSPTFNVNLDALSVTGSYTPGNSQFDSAGTTIAAAFITPSSPEWAGISTDDAASEALANYINNASVAGGVLTLRLTPQSAPDGYYLLGASDWSGMNATITLTTASVPEPASLTLLGLGAAIFMKRKLHM